MLLVKYIFFNRFDFELMNIAKDGLKTTFGSLEQRITNTVYTNGEIDPWFYHGILFTHDHNSTVFNIECKCR